MPSSPSELLRTVPSQELVPLFDRLDDVYFFMKDAKSRFLHANRALVRRLRLTDLSQLVGTTDYDRYPAPLADRLIADDQAVMTSGEPLINQIEVLFDDLGNLDWFTTCKYPLRDGSGRVIGVMGIFRGYEGSPKLVAAYSAVAKAVAYARDHPAEPLRVKDLAHHSGISERQLHRRFQNALGMSAQEFLLRNRIQAAAGSLRETDESIAAIALQFGFCDQSAFSKQFKKLLGATPATYRRRYRE